MTARKKNREEDRSEAPRERGGIQLLERAFAILEEVARNRQGINLAELSKAVGLHNSTTFHLVKTMAQLGYVSHVRDSKRYRIGARRPPATPRRALQRGLYSRKSPCGRRSSCFCKASIRWSVRTTCTRARAAQSTSSG
jgi:hypothetical protein